MNFSSVLETSETHGLQMLFAQKFIFLWFLVALPQGTEWRIWSLVFVWLLSCLDNNFIRFKKFQNQNVLSNFDLLDTLPPPPPHCKGNLRFGTRYGFTQFGPKQIFWSKFFLSKISLDFNKKPEGFMQSCTLFKQVKSHISHFLMRSMGTAILEKLSSILWNSL